MGWAGHGAGHCSEASKAQAGKQWAWIPAQAPAGWQTHQPAFVLCVWPPNDVFLPCWHHDLLAGHAPVKRLYRSAPTCRSWNCAQLPSALALRLFTVVWIWPPVAMATRWRSSSATCREKARNARAGVECWLSYAGMHLDVPANSTEAYAALPCASLASAPQPQSYNNNPTLTRPAQKMSRSAKYWVARSPMA